MGFVMYKMINGDEIFIKHLGFAVRASFYQSFRLMYSSATT